MAGLRFTLLASTAIAASGLALSASLGWAADLGAVPVAVTARSAVDGINAAFSLFGGGGSNQNFTGGTGKVTLPLSQAFGTQIDATVTGGRGSYVSLADHLFWRDPGRGLVGLYGSYSRHSADGGAHVGRIAAEGEIYWGQLTLRGIVGLESGHSSTLDDGQGTLTDHDLKSRFFDMVDLAFYPTDNTSLFVGHRYVGGSHALALGGEYLAWNSGGTGIGLFAEGRIGEGDYRAAWAGVRVHFGQSAKSLIRRDREDDPIAWEPDTLLSLHNTLKTSCAPDYVMGPDGCESDE